MTARRDRSPGDPHGPTALPDEQPITTGTDVGDQPALRMSAPSRWLVPAAVLAAVAVVLFCFALRLQLVLPLVGLVYVVVAWLVMLLIARRGASPLTSRRLAWAMGILAAGALLTAIGIYVVEAQSPA